MLVILLAAKSLSWAKIQARPYLGLYFIALFFFAVWGPVYNSSPRAPYFAGFILHNTFLVLAQFTMLSQEYSEARRRGREMEAKNNFYHRMAHDLLNPLTVVSTNIQVAAMFSQEAPELLEKAQAEIMNMAEKINEVLNEGNEGNEDGDDGSKA
jgi:signal transduction histidine kinase